MENRDRVELRELDPGNRLPTGLRAQQVPRHILGGREYVIVDAVELTGNEEIVVFATAGTSQRIGVMLESGIDTRINADDRLVTASPSVEEFTRVARVLLNWYRQLTGPACGSVSDIRAHLVRIAPKSFRDENGSWTTMLDDIEIGDHDT